MGTALKHAVILAHPRAESFTGSVADSYIHAVGRHSAGAPRLTGRSLISFSSSGGPTAWLQKTGSLPAVEALFDTYFVELCGLGMLGHFHFGAITPGASDTFIAARLQEVSQIVGTAFGHTS